MVKNKRDSGLNPILALLLLLCFATVGEVASYAQQPSEDGLVNRTRPRRVAQPNALAADILDAFDDTAIPEEARTLAMAYPRYGATANPQPPTTEALRLSAAELRASFKASTAPGSMAFVSPMAVSTAPMSVGEKFHGWFKAHFLTPGAYLGVVPKAMWSELQDNDDNKKDTVKNFLADSMTRSARSFASSATTSFYEKALLASLFKQDPRYHRSGKRGAGEKLVYAVTRVFVTQGDRCGCNQFNASFLLGGAMGAVTANVWERPERTGPIHTAKRWGNHIAFTALTNLIKEFVGGQ